MIRKTMVAFMVVAAAIPAAGSAQAGDYGPGWCYWHPYACYGD